MTIDAERHAEKMKARKAHQDKIVAERQTEKGLLIVHTGKGKGKSTAAFGMAMRAIAHGMKVGVVQFVKGPWESGERDLLRQFPQQVEIHAMGEGFTWETQDRERDVRAAREAWEMSKKFIADPDVRLVILDELNIVLRYDYLALDEVLEAIRSRPADCHVVATGRNAKDELIEIADLVTEMTQVKHPFRDGVKAQAGIEF
ncbi:cob(I)yrinic acid a,c-diamide adenosyltransferase [Chenggangzhangella methanolivorans]|uniref:Corrinoid adenosyltransferase n=1 Tax=Chenggangzhangella methanolivorans TaxID=1437009 RepID=A0A9E6UML8_9HYPH|nr:cob(I)yrinic acid a,c-diamide adenosyltransferase [Chenggangzhangella methanolivorans]QZO00136.1 cob(I)yrinic acid a,c-diamide adenosyltransferase [Chenggangzhangella methanolivorans]